MFYNDKIKIYNIILLWVNSTTKTEEDKEEEVEIEDVEVIEVEDVAEEDLLVEVEVEEDQKYSSNLIDFQVYLSQEDNKTH